MGIAANSVIAFATIRRVKRGYYETSFEIAEEHPQSVTEVELTRRFVNYLETNIRKYPDNWLWSHRRWKHEWKEEYDL